MTVEKVSSILSNYTVPTFQRPIDKDHINNIADSLLKIQDSGAEPRLTGCLIIVVSRQSGTRFLVDGNHRLAAYAQLYEKTGTDLLVYVQTITVPTDEDAGVLFEQVNRNLPLAELPAGVKRACANEVARHFFDKYHKLFRDTPSGSTVRPFVSRTQFTKAIGQILGTIEEDTKVAINLIEDYISFLADRSERHFKRNGDKVDKLSTLITKADGLGCRLGLVHMEDMVKHICPEQRVSPEPQVSPKKASIPKPLRMAVWNRYIGPDARIGSCPFCKTEIRLENFHCAHDVASADGGLATIDNLYPACAQCNVSMGKAQFEEFAKRWRTIIPKTVICKPKTTTIV